MDKTKQTNLQNLEIGKEVFAHLSEICEDPMKHNEALLMQMLEMNKDTEFGKKMGFADMHSIEDFQRKMPITTYDDYVEYILRMTENGENGLFFAEDIHHYNRTSGTTGTPKRIPMSDQALETFVQYTEYCHLGVIESTIGPDFTNGRHIRLMEATDKEQYLPCGATFGAISQKQSRSMRSKLPDIFTAPDEALYPRGDTNTRYLHARYALMDKGAVCLHGTFFSFLLEQMRYIEKEWKMLCHDIETGTIDASIRMPEDVRAKLENELKPMPERAAELRAIFEEGFETPIMKRLWPEMRFVIGIASGSFAAQYKMMNERYIGDDGIRLLKFGIAASEGLFTVAYAMDRDDTVIIPDSVFYEFLPLEADDDFSQIVTLDKVEEGKEYELIVTNTSGLCRYRMKDIVRIAGKFKNTPTLTYSTRRDHLVSIMGEKTSEQALTAAIQNTADELGFTLVDYSVYPDMNSVPVRYQYFVEVENVPSELNPKIIREVLEKYIAEANPSMGQKVKSKVCGDTRLNFLEPETYLLYKDMMIAKGTASTQVKPVHIISNERQRKFFFGMTEYSAEVMR
ncbi:MAG: GH3 auxin-responsive promoter family protein [Oscillospiraceae bacterium]|nr:GH3 auxin-responsive promoter family protein [Oscillospiraceae bacterium]